MILRGELCYRFFGDHDVVEREFIFSIYFDGLEEGIIEHTNKVV